MMLKPVEALNLSANYTWMDAESRETGLGLARRPKHSINASAAYRWPFGLETGATIVHVGSSFDDASNTRKLGGYVLVDVRASIRSEEHTSELQSLMRISYAVFCLKKKNTTDI